MIVDLDDIFIKEIIYKYYHNENKVDNWYNKLCEESPIQTKFQYKNIAFYLSELAIKDLEKNSIKYKFLKIWNKEYVEPLLDFFQISQKSIKNCLYFYNNLSTTFLKIVNNPEQMYLLSKDEYIAIHNKAKKFPDLKYYFECRDLYFKNFKLQSEINFIENKFELKIFNYINRHAHQYYDIVILPEFKILINKIISKIKKLNIKVCSCKRPHTNLNVIDVGINNFKSIYFKIIEKKNENIFECYENDLIFNFFTHLSKIESI